MDLERKLAVLADAAKYDASCASSGGAKRSAAPGRGMGSTTGMGCAARLMLVGEQPGDEEDLQGRPFIGPAGKLLSELLRSAGLRREDIYITNAVKHFKWEPRGKRRLHKRPNVGEIRACNAWLQGEIGSVKPTVMLALGASALTALYGGSQSIEAARATVMTHRSGATLLASYHPSAILRADAERSGVLRAALLEDLRRAMALSTGRVVTSQ
jgi:uracil-DNA glycosylase family protein